MEMFCGGIFFGIIISIIMICLIAMVCKQEPDDQELNVNAEAAKIALQTINMDLLSGVEKRSINYALESIDIRNKIEHWIEEKEKENEN